MKKLLFTILFTLVISEGAYAKIGKGEIKLSEKVTNNFIEFLRNEYANYFMITPDGSNSLFTVCGAEFCEGGMRKALKWCREDYGQKCLVFAQRKKQVKIIRWNKADYSFPKDDWNYNVMVNVKYLKSYNKGIKQSISDDQIKGVLNNLGFINFDKVVASEDIKPKDVGQKKFLNNDVVKKPKAVKKITQQQQSEIDQIKEMFDIGALTKDEYNAAVERVLK